MQKLSSTGTLIPVEFKNSETTVRVVMRDDEPMFVARDVFQSLGIKWQGVKSLIAIPKHWRGVSYLPTTSGNPLVKSGIQMKELIVINEAAVYKLAFRSEKPEADRFVNWVCSEVLPSIRRTGAYQMPEIQGVQSKLINERRILPYCDFMRSLNARPGGSAYARKKRYPQHFVVVNGVLHISYEFAQVIEANRHVIERRKEVKAMQPILPLDFYQPDLFAISVKGGEA